MARQHPSANEKSVSGASEHGQRRRGGRGRSIALLIAATTAVVLIAFFLDEASAGSDPAFLRMPLPEGSTGDCKAVGDIDGDGLLDVLVGGSGPEEPLVWYRNGTWARRTIAVSTQEFSNFCTMADVNRDGRPDVIVPDATIEPDNLFWFENPGRDAALGGSSWTRHPIGHTGAWCKDVLGTDLDSDGRLDVVARPQSRDPVFFFQERDGTWTRVALKDVATGREGMAVGDVDADGHADVVLRGSWVQNPGQRRARIASAWTAHTIGKAPENFKAFIADVDGDGDADVLFSSSEHEAPVVWWERTGPDPNRWTRHVITERALGAHTLWSVDIDGDGRRDVLTAEVRRPRVTWYKNVDGRGLTWRVEPIETKYGSIHNGVVADLDRDGDLDLFGAGYTHQPTRATIWWNQLDPRRLPIGAFTAVEVTGHHRRALGLTTADLSGDGIVDIASGRYWYENPGGDLSGAWRQHAFPKAGGLPLDAVASVTTERGASDIVGITPDARVWRVRRKDTHFDVEPVGRIPEVDHEISSQGVEVARLRPGGPAELLVSNGGNEATGVGIYAFRIEPGGPWPRRRITNRTSDEGLAVGDIDRDGDLDVVGTRGDLGQVEWYENPGAEQHDWPAHPIAEIEDVRWLDRTRVADINCDARLDVVVTEENGEAHDAETYWLEQPASPTASNWPAHLVTSQGSTNSLDVADFDRDGDVDLVTGEHRGALRVILWENVDCGSFEPHPIDRGKESHLGTRAIDLDDDGDLDLINIAWDAPNRIDLWRNDAISLERSSPPAPSNRVIE